MMRLISWAISAWKAKTSTSASSSAAAAAAGVVVGSVTIASSSPDIVNRFARSRNR